MDGRRKRRTYNTRLIRRQCCYRIEQIAELFGICRQAVRRWLREGLPRIDDQRPFLIHGSDLIAFLDARQARRKRKCAAGEIYCCRCRQPRLPRRNVVWIEFQGATRLILSAECGICGAGMKQAGSMRKLVHYRSMFSVQTTGVTRINERSKPGVMCHLDEENRDAQLQPEK